MRSTTAEAKLYTLNDLNDRFDSPETGGFAFHRDNRADGELRGAPASRGQVTGPARILHSPEEGDLLRPGEILVCAMATPAWSPLFSVAAGIITETGGALSSFAITAREYGIPTVVAVKNATTRIRDGQIVTVDGTLGAVWPH